MNDTNEKINEENVDCPKMLQVFSEHAYHEVFCYALAFEKVTGKRAYDVDKLLMTVISGSDSAIQSIKAAIDIGSQYLSFGFGTKGHSSYEFTKEKGLSAEKGRYDKIPMPINRNRKALAIIHEDITSNKKYVLSFDGSPAKEIANLLGGPQYGLHILKEWEDTVFKELIHLGYLVQHEIYADKNLFPSLEMYSIDLIEEQADQFISDLLKSGKIKFPVEGDGSAVAEINGLAPYLLQHTNDMVKKVTSFAIPEHDPIHDNVLDIYKSYTRELFPVQGHVGTASAKHLLNRKALILQGEMSTGKSAVMTAIADGYAHLKKMKGYFSVLICPPSLTNKWPKEIKMLIPHAEVIVVKKTEELIHYHANWVRHGRNKPTRPVFFVISFTTLRNDAAIRPAVEFKRIVTKHQIEEQSSSYRNGYYCPSCGKAHQTIESTDVEIQDDKEIHIHTTHNMTPEEFGTSRRLNKSTTYPPNAFCYHCGESLWTRKVKRRYKNFAEWVNRVEKPLLSAILAKDESGITQILAEQPEYPTSTSVPRRVAAIEYIRRKMKGDIDFCIVDEVHERVTRFSEIS